MLRLFGEYRAEQAGSLDFESQRNTDNADLFEAIIREVYEGVTFVAAGHHVMFTREGHPVPGEVASADTLIFDHDIARKLWGAGFKDVLARLACEPAPARDALLRSLYYGRRSEN
ncbi:hypothetical protein [Bradyrhizobium canariense]|uniref:hypothetical protein n=1 Tax=Bradyrhizobium canariense TaxID=255045 RepID=UPI00195D58E2|nr:hypothetical protein [Bradyrhizobium canariense]MBM7483334.1 hypothetical protein [Bradyrhizobium canariense]